MPYVITTTRPDLCLSRRGFADGHTCHHPPRRRHAGRDAHGCADRGRGRLYGYGRPALHRTAAGRTIHDDGDEYQHKSDALRLPGRGGTVGPPMGLPDVRTREGLAEVIAAYNAAQAEQATNEGAS